MSEDLEYEPDRIPGTPHPRHTLELFGQDAAEEAFLDVWRSGRLHHAWLLTGPMGVGKATLAWRIARFLLSDPDAGAITLDISRDEPVAHRIDALSEPALFLMRPTANPDTGTERRDITVDVSRRLKGFLQLSASGGGRRVVIVDAADQLNTQAANAILKLIEEPPPLTTFLLVSHMPARLLPTIRSRCRVLKLGPLTPDDLARALDGAGVTSDANPHAMAELAGGSAGEAARLVLEDGPSLYAALVQLASGIPQMDRPALTRLGDGLAGAGGRGRMETLVRLIGLLLGRLARTGAGHAPAAQAAPGEAEMLERLSPDSAAARIWAELAAELSQRLAHGRAVNLDPSGLILDTGLKLNDTGRAILRGETYGH
ncbi:DNA polymerase III subunit delta' [Palleronia caenipelagi]|uniref:DNA polymerase III subunit delta n=1 Tax=Palleronia caenipelagi TaxID=2489174 RepID=A0A547Q8Y1_9RHOB|nr:DNA polymerase III subunit delta' [Palleronia caenipelagi]TRD22832.1 DNA polymerase III subunit delta' [Palleronia caenipelagi]